MREEDVAKERAEYLKLLAKEERKNKKLAYKQLIVDTVRRKYSELWLRKRLIKEKVTPRSPLQEDRSVERDLFLVRPASLWQQQTRMQEEDTYDSRTVSGAP